MNTDLIIANEAANSGNKIFLYFNDEVGFYTAYGLSAFYVSHVIDPLVSYSAVMDMPVVLVDPYQVKELIRSTIKRQHESRKFYLFETKSIIGTAGYDIWSERYKYLK